MYSDVVPECIRNGIKILSCRAVLCCLVWYGMLWYCVTQCVQLGVILQVCVARCTHVFSDVLLFVDILGRRSCRLEICYITHSNLERFRSPDVSPASIT